MGADLSRIRFDHLADYASVVLAQGRLVLDSDWNEQAAIVDRRLRAQAVDLGGPVGGGGSALVSRQTPNAFKVTLASGMLSIGRGRVYVDGILVENHGVGAAAFDPALAETYRADGIAYDAQPHLPEPAELPTTGTHLVYLDVWQREVTALEDADLVEPAIGVDTSARTQHVWQVKVLRDVPDGTTCTTPDDRIPAWAALTAPSSGRLSTGVVEVDEPDDLCHLPPEGGYRGPENQFYRVEIHDGGDRPTFKWSRENASVASTVAEVVSATELRLASLGKDSVLRFSTGDWVEVIDDHRELAGEPGDLRRIEVDEGAGTITLDTAISDDLVAAGDLSLARHLRVRRWDQKGTSAVLPVPADGSAVVLEHGITVTFSRAKQGGPMRTGEFWCFAARVAHADVEQLVNAPPRGIHHHYARLAVLSLPDSVVDCRQPAAEDGCACDVCVSPADHAAGTLTIQDAINRVAAAGGGAVRLCAGQYVLREPLRLEKVRSVRLYGQGESTRLVTNGTAVAIARGFGVSVAHLSIHSGGSGPAITLSDTVDCGLDGLHVQVEAADRGERAAVELSGVQALTAIRSSHLLAPVGITAEERGLLTLDLAIERNVLRCPVRGIDLGALALHLGATRIAGNDISGCDRFGIMALGGTSGGPLTVADNVLRLGAGAGIAVGGHAVVSGNTVGAATRRTERHAIALLAGQWPETGESSARVTGNRVRGSGGAGLSASTPMSSLVVSGNQFLDTATGIELGTRLDDADVSIVDNDVRDVVPAIAVEGDPKPGDRTCGIAVAGGGSVVISGNTVRGVAREATQFLERYGIRVSAVGEVRIAGNTVAEIGGEQDFGGVAVGIGVVGHQRLDLEGNTVSGGAIGVAPRRAEWSAIVVTTGAGPRLTPPATSPGASLPGASLPGRLTDPRLGRIAAGTLLAGAAGAVNPAEAVTPAGPVELVPGRGESVASAVSPALAASLANRLTPAPLAHLAGATKVVPLRDQLAIFADGRLVLVPATVAEHCTMVGNSAQGGGTAPALLVDIDGDALVQGNWCIHSARAEDPALQVNAATAIVTGNRVRGGAPAVRIDVDERHTAVIGNIVSGRVEVAGSTVTFTGTPSTQLNPSA